MPEQLEVALDCSQVARFLIQEFETSVLQPEEMSTLQLERCHR